MQYKSFMEALKGKQHKIDKNKNGKIDAHDFKLLRKEEAEQLEEGLDPSEVASNPKIYDAATVKKAYYHKSTSAADKEYLAKHLDRHHGNKEWRKPVKEETELTEATVKTQKYSWGTMKTVHHGADFSIPLHPEHHQAISKLKDNQEHKFKDETGRHWTAKRMGDDVHFQGANNGGTTKVKHSDLKEETDQEERMSRSDYKVGPSGRKSHKEIVFKHGEEDKKASIQEVAPPGFEGTVKAMKKHKEIDNPYALAWYLKNKGAKSHKNPDGTMKNEGVTGAVAGGIMGGMAAGPLGAVAGAYLGHKLQQGANNAKKLVKQKEDEKRLRREEVEDLEESMTDSWKNIQSMDKGSVTGGKDEVKKRLAYLNAVHAHHKKFGNDTKKVKSEIESINRSRIAEELEEGYVVRYNNPGHDKHGSERHFDNQESADKHAARGNSVDKSGGKYTVHKTNEKGHVKEETDHIEEGMQQTLRKYVPGYAKKQIDNKMDAGKFGKDDVAKDANFYRYKKIQDKLKKEEFEIIEEGMKTTHEDPLVTVHDKDGLHTHANLSTANQIFGTKVKHTDVHAGAVSAKNREGKDLKFAISKHHAQAVKDEEKFRKQFGEQAPVAPTLDRKYIKGTPEHKAYKATKKPINGHPTNVKEESGVSYKDFIMMLEYESKDGVYKHKGTYGGNYVDPEGADDADDKKPMKPATEKRGRGRPAGSKSGARKITGTSKLFK